MDTIAQFPVIGTKRRALAELRGVKGGPARKHVLAVARSASE
jgi:hypothetical protein